MFGKKIRKQIDCKRPSNTKQMNLWTEYKIFGLKYENTKLLGNTKYNQVKLVSGVFVCSYFYQYSIKLY